jgi:hypothetical protein
MQGDFSGWLRTFLFNETHELEEINLWNNNVGATIHISENPTDGCIYLTSIWPSKIKRICFGGNLKPIISASPEVVYGIGELEINFDASQSYDPEGQPLTFEWDFGDGSTGNGSEITHIFTPGGSNMENFQTTLIVTDPEGASSQQVIPVSLNNTPPSAEITSISDGELYGINAPTLMNLIADASDAESVEEDLEFNWQLLLHHNTHFHYMETVEGNNQTYLLSPTGCSEEETYWYEYVLTVTDPGGLFDTDSVELFPDCDGTLQNLNFDAPLLVYPNPVTSTRINILSQIDLGTQVNYELYNSLGEFIDAGVKQINNQRKYFALTLPRLVDGVYVLRFKVKGDYYNIRILAFQE